MVGGLAEHLPSVRGRYASQVSLSPLTWFRVGGPAEVLYKPESVEDLSFFLSHRPLSIPVQVMGVASNLLIRDGGLPGVTLRLTRGFNDIQVNPEAGTVTAGAGALDRTVAMMATEAGIEGLEFLAGIPGTLGGALRMNAGAYGTEIKDVLREAQALTPEGKLVTLYPSDFGFSYRQCEIPAEWIFVRGTLKGQKGDSSKSRQTMESLLRQREATQPVRTRTGGSTFANPEGQKAWVLIDQAGCRGLKRGGAQVSELHCNFLVNTGGATAEDLESLGEDVRARVLSTQGVELRWEIHRLGVKEGEGKK